MRFRHLLCGGLVSFVAFSVSMVPANGATNDPIKDAQLSPESGILVLSDETAFLEAFKSLQASKLEADKETRARHSLDLQLAAKQKIIKDSAREWHDLETRLSLVTNENAHNHLVLRMNRLVGDQKSAMDAEKDLDDELGKLSSSGKVKYVDQLAALDAQAQELSARYKALAGDAAITAAIAKMNIAAATKVALGPSAQAGTAIQEVRKQQAGIASEAIPLSEHNGVRVVNVLVNGEQIQMVVDTGASDVVLPGDVAEHLGLIPGEQDPVVQLKLADGNMIEGKVMSLKTVRVGRFTAEDVTCFVLSKDLPNPPTLLGGSFLNRFVVNLDGAANQLHLTELNASNTAKPVGAKPDNAP